MDTGRGVLNTGVYWGEKARASGRGRWGEIAWGKMPNVGEGEKGSKTAMCVPTQLSCMFCSCTPKPKMQYKIKKKEVNKTRNKNGKLKK